jgi:fused signal recognition particle receptor
MAFQFWKKKKDADPAISVSDTVSGSPVSTQDNEALVEVTLPKRSAKKAIRSIFSRIRFDPENLELIEETLIQADFGLEAAEAIVSKVKDLARNRSAKTNQELRQILTEVIAQGLEHPAKALNLSSGTTPYVLLVVGVNGVGKTTTIGKLSNWLVQGGFSVTIAAADTFRAAAVDQLETWASRSGAKLVKPAQEGQDPAAVSFEATEQAVREGADVLIIDTAGRLQNKSDLMDQLGKISRVIEKQAKIAEVLLVLDATTGQNGLTQAKAFTQIANVTGIVLTKLDGSAKGGIVYSVQQELGIPVKLVGTGEGIEDFAFFDAAEFAAGLVGLEDA